MTRAVVAITTALLLALCLTGCPQPEDPEPQTYTLTYDLNGGVGTVPVDPNRYEQGDPVTVLEPGDISKDGFTFATWNVFANGSGIDFDPGAEYSMPNNDATLFAKWQPVIPAD